VAQKVVEKAAENISGTSESASVSKLLRLHNAPGGIDENGEPLADDPANFPVANKINNPAAVIADECEILSYSVSSLIVEPTCETLVPATPTTVTYNLNGYYQPINLPYNIIMPFVSGTSYYPLYEVALNAILRLLTALISKFTAAAISSPVAPSTLGVTAGTVTKPVTQRVAVA
jgi:hypothetical protein